MLLVRLQQQPHNEIAVGFSELNVEDGAFLAVHEPMGACCAEREVFECWQFRVINVVLCYECSCCSDVLVQQRERQDGVLMEQPCFENISDLLVVLFLLEHPIDVGRVELFLKDVTSS